VKTMMRSLGLAFLVGALLVVGACAPDHESDAQKLQSASGPPPEGANKNTPVVVTQPKNQEEYAQRKNEQIKKGTKSAEYLDKSSGSSSRR
jgi:hypothetical protein